MEDTHTIQTEACAQAFTNHLNLVDEDIKRTIEGEVAAAVPVDEEVGASARTKRTLAFLDTWSEIKEDGTIKTRVFRKETDKDQYLNFASNHPLEKTSNVWLGL